mmetsp:Transcript_4828/g.6928  ORF Transcript_4828/g.6928 Transcript_4828/m.6928 type:complete len:200 (-) Transcript_4828:492-1091(-)
MITLTTTTTTTKKRRIVVKEGDESQKLSILVLQHLEKLQSRTNPFQMTKLMAQKTITELTWAEARIIPTMVVVTENHKALHQLSMRDLLNLQMNTKISRNERKETDSTIIVWIETMTEENLGPLTHTMITLSTVLLRQCNKTLDLHELLNQMIPTFLIPIGFQDSITIITVIMTKLIKNTMILMPIHPHPFRTHALPPL